MTVKTFVKNPLSRPGGLVASICSVVRDRCSAAREPCHSQENNLLNSASRPGVCRTRRNDSTITV